MRHPISGGLATRCAGLSPPLALALLLVLALLVAGSISALPGARAIISALPSAGLGVTDVVLYRSLVDQVRDGRDYYHAAIETQRASGFPVQPFFTVRLPTLTWTIAALSPDVARLLLLFLVTATITAWALSLARMLSPSFAYVIAVLSVALGLLFPVVEPAMWFTEIWAGVLIALSLAVRREDRWWPSVALGLVAVFIRELALIYLIAMGTMAVIGGHRREALAWGVAVCLFVIAYAWHAHSVLSLVQAGDPVSPGWNGRGGWAFFISASVELTVLSALPLMWAAVLLPLSYFALAVTYTPVIIRTFVTFVSYTLLLVIFARRNNNYWIFMIGPILLLGIAFAPFAIADLVRSVFGWSGRRTRRTAEEEDV